LKKPKIKHAPSTAKSPSFNELYAHPKKEPKKAADPEDYLKEHPSWRLNNAQMEHPFGWHDIDSATAGSIRKKLADFESMTWAEILVKASDRNHHIPVTKLSTEARNALMH
jgi:hypothetical protein